MMKSVQGEGRRSARPGCCAPETSCSPVNEGDCICACCETRSIRVYEDQGRQGEVAADDCEPAFENRSRKGGRRWRTQGRVRDQETGSTRHCMEEGEGIPPPVPSQPSSTRHPALRVRTRAFHYDSTHTVSAFPCSPHAQTASVFPWPGGAPGGGAYLGSSYCGGGGYCSSGAGGGPLGCRIYQPSTPPTLGTREGRTGAM
jgi:hypothetical protein